MRGCSVVDCKGIAVYPTSLCADCKPVGWPQHSYPPREVAERRLQAYLLSTSPIALEALPSLAELRAELGALEIEFHYAGDGQAGDVATRMASVIGQMAAHGRAVA